MSWLTLAAVKAAKNITGTSQDVAIEALLPIAEAFVAEQLSYFCARQVVTEQHDGLGCDEIVLAKRPVCGVHSLKDSLTRAWSTTDDIDESLYVARKNGRLTLDGSNPELWIGDGPGAFQDGNGNVRVIYVAGYGERVDTVSDPAPDEDHEDFEEFALPQDVVKFAADYVMACLNTAGGEGLSGESAGGYSYTVASADAFFASCPGAKETAASWRDGTGLR